MASNIITNKLATLVALGVAKRVAFLKKGANDYFSSQITKMMRPGETYSFIIPDSGTVSEGLVATPRQLQERKVDLTIKNYNNSLQINALELAVDANDLEKWANNYAAKLVEVVLKNKVPEAADQSTVAFLGAGFAPLSLAGQHVATTTDAELYGFINPACQSVLSSNGQSFIPKQAESIYDHNAFSFENVEYSPERFLKPVKISSDVAAAVNGATVTTSSAADTVTVTLSGSANLPEGLPITIDGLYACDVVGMPTSTPRTFIVPSAVSAASAITFDCIFEDIGARDTYLSEETPSIVELASGTYNRALVRADGSYDYTPAPALQFLWSNKDSVAEGDVDGIGVQVNGFSNGVSGENLVRFDLPQMAGVVEKRAMAVAYITSKNNLVNQNG